MKQKYTISMIVNMNNRVFGLDLMRAGAILMVLCSHLLWIYPLKNPLLLYCFQLFGFLGVEIFFVLSGFLIGTIFYNLYLQDDFKFKSVTYFLKRRWYRTLPNYYLFFIINILIGLIVGYPMPSLWKYLFFQQNFYTTMLAFYPDSWSLAVEEYTYLIMPTSVFLMAVLCKPKNKKNAYLFVIVSIIIAFIFSKFIYNQTTTNTTMDQWNVSMKDVVIYRIDAILVGVVFSWISLNYENFWRKSRYVLAYIGVFFYLIFYYSLGHFRIFIENYPMFWNVFYLPITSFSVALFLPLLSEWKTTTIPFKNIIVTISLISYSFYLLHYGIVLQLMKHYCTTENLKQYELHIFTLVFLILSFGLSYLNYKYFEKPMMDLRDKN
jgi:peptidoglycan/LPS O-acetylase OafA/YrhL